MCDVKEPTYLIISEFKFYNIFFLHIFDLHLNHHISLLLIPFIADRMKEPYTTAQWRKVRTLTCLPCYKPPLDGFSVHRISSCLHGFAEKKELSLFKYYGVVVPYGRELRTITGQIERLKMASV